MMRVLKTPIFAIGLLVMIAGSLLMSPQGAAAATVGVTGQVEGGGTFEGVVLNAEFVAHEEALVFEGTLDGVITIDGEETAVVQSFSEFASVSESPSCSTVTYFVDTIAIEQIDADVALDPVTVEKPERGLLGGLFGGDLNVYCEVGELLGNGETADLADLLNEILGN